MTDPAPRPLAVLVGGSVQLDYETPSEAHTDTFSSLAKFDGVTDEVRADVEAALDALFEALDSLLNAQEGTDD